MTDLRTAAKQALEALQTLKDRGVWGDFDGVADALKEALVEEALQRFTDVSQEIEAALAEPVQEPVAWMHNLIDDNIITHRPADIDRHPDRWTALYPEPKPCPTCEALARTVMMDQTGYDTAPPQRKPLTETDVYAISDDFRSTYLHGGTMFDSFDALGFARAIERAHGIGDNT